MLGRLISSRDQALVWAIALAGLPFVVTVAGIVRAVRSGGRRPSRLALAVLIGSWMLVLGVMAGAVPARGASRTEGRALDVELHGFPRYLVISIVIVVVLPLAGLAIGGRWRPRRQPQPAARDRAGP